MMKNILLAITVSFLFFLSCSGPDADYGLCKKGTTRCTGNKLEMCTDFEDWALKTECDFFGGECVADGKNAYCTNVEDDAEWFDGYFDWGEEEDDDYIEEDDDTIVHDYDTYDEDIVEPDDGNDEEIFDEDEHDIDIIDEDVVEPVCGNGELETGEVCEKGDLTDCTEIDPEKYSGGKAFCLDDCLGYNTITCSEK